MSGFEVYVTNKSPETRKNVPKWELELFQKYMEFKTGSKNFYPFRHQAEAFEVISNDENALLVAGTAAGKTLAVAIPVFIKLLQGKIKKLMFMYPTIALMEDQQRVLLDIAKLLNLEDEIGHIQGGMTRGQLISNLSKKIIVATPDSVYWFFRKNIKYSSLLIYGLSCVDEFILDEAHVFSGLTIQNLKLFFARIKILRKRFMNKGFKLHILTATPREEIFGLNKGKVINGRSKCEDVKVIFYNVSPFERSDKYKDLLMEAIKQGYKKILVIQNSAMNAHRMFRDISDFKARQSLSPEQYIQFGRMRKSTLEEYLKNRVSGEKIQKLYSADEDDIEYRLKEFENVRVLTESQHLFESLRSCFYICRGKMNQALYGMFKEKFDKKFSLNTFLICLKKKNKALRKLFLALNNEDNKGKSFGYYELKNLIDTSFERFLEELEDRVDAVSPGIDYPSLDIIDQILSSFDSVIIDYIKNAFSRDFRFKKSAIVNFEGRLPRQSSQYIYFKWLKSYFGEYCEEVYSIIINLLKEDKVFREKIEFNHVGVVKKSDYPIIVYSGSMSKSAREGLIALFDELDRAVLVSTSAVEVGVDFDADLLITEQCESGAFMQRFGRVGRGTNNAEAWVIVDGEYYGEIKDEIKRASMTREEFTDVINAVFTNRKSIGDSRLLEANFVNVNRQLGEIGRIINEDSKISRQSIVFAKELEEKQIELNYGLRSTLPSVSLLDRGVTKDVFQLLQYLPIGDLEVTSDGFEIAKANVNFIELLYAKKEWQVYVDLDETLKNCETIFSYNADKDEISIMKNQNLGMRKYSLIRQMIDLYKLETHPLLIYGDIYLKRDNKEFFKHEKIKDAYDTPLTMKNQFCLIFPAISDINLLRGKGFADIEEIYYDVDFDGISKNGKDLVLLDNIQGACLSLYKIMVNQGR